MEISPTVVELEGADQLALWLLTAVALATLLLVTVVESVSLMVDLLHGAIVHQPAKVSILISQGTKF